MPVFLYVISLKIPLMHNFVKPTTPVKDALKSVKKGLQSPKKEFFAKNEAAIETLYDNYDKMAANDELHKLSPLWQINPADDKRTILFKKAKMHLVYKLYGSKRPFVNDHWEAVTKSNGGETLYCPICGLHECEEMDHFVPREEDLFPEYSAHLSNLIPLCHNCNHKKSTKFLDEKGKRIFFNAFFDLLTKRDILECNIISSPLDGMPQIKTDVSPGLNASKKPDMYILSTITDLELIDRFRAKAKMHFKKEMSRLTVRAGQDWTQIKTEYVALSTPGTGEPDVVYPAVMKAIAESPIMESWFKSL